MLQQMIPLAIDDTVDPGADDGNISIATRCSNAAVAACPAGNSDNCGSSLLVLADQWTAGVPITGRSATSIPNTQARRVQKSRIAPTLGPSSNYENEADPLIAFPCYLKYHNL